jgi:hypothetical protein
MGEPTKRSRDSIVPKIPVHRAQVDLTNSLIDQINLQTVIVMNHIKANIYKPVYSCSYQGETLLNFW